MPKGSPLNLACVIGSLWIAWSCGSDSEEPGSPTGARDAGGSSAQGGAASGSGGTAGGAAAASGAGHGGAGHGGAGHANAGSGGENSAGESATAGKGGDDGQAGAGAGGQGGSVWPDSCVEDADCDAGCQSYGWPEGRCYGSLEPSCGCTTNADSPTCTEGTTEGCPPGMGCEEPATCMPYGAGTDGDPCPDGDECQLDHVCVGYGNPLPNGESTACRLECSSDAPPPDCDCVGGYCTGNGDGGGGQGGNVGGCSDMIENPGCADAKVATTDFESAVFGSCGHLQDLGDGTGWVDYDAHGGFSVDVATGTGWLARSNAGTMTKAQVEVFCADLVVGGLADWRLPTIDEARSLAAGCSDTAPGGSCPITAADPACLDTSCGIGSECDSCSGKQGPNASKDYCRPEVSICFGFHTSSLCTDCASLSAWTYAIINGNFYASSVDNVTWPVCVTDDVPSGVPCAE